MERWAVVSTSRICVGFVASALGLRQLTLLDGTVSAARKRMAALFPEARPDPKLLPELQRQLRDYFAGRRVRFRARFDLTSVTSFHRRVLLACAEVPYGQTVSYGELARRVGSPRAARAVGSAMARNPIPIVIPCHRVLGSDGRLCGYSAAQGLPLKAALLDMESALRERSTPDLSEPRP